MINNASISLVMPFNRAFAIIACVLLGACTTVGTQRLVLAEPMSEDLEARVLRETGLSGALLGGLAGAAVGFGAGFLAATAAGEDAATAALVGAGTAVPGAIGGGIYGHGVGKRQGEKIVAATMSRDQLADLLKGAKAYNNRLSTVNSQLGDELASLRSQEPSRQKSRASNQISRLAVREIKEADKRISAREAAINNPQWADSQKKDYQRELNRLVVERNQLADIQNAATQLASR